MKRRARIIICNLVLAAVLVFGTLGILFFDEVIVRAVSAAALLVAVLYTAGYHFYGYEGYLFSKRPTDLQAEPEPDAPRSLLNLGTDVAIYDEKGHRIQGTSNCLNYARPRVYEGPRKCARVAAALHAHLCDHEAHGYSRGEGRWGISGEYCGVLLDGIVYYVNKGERDSSSSVIESWRRAIAGTPFEGVLDAATYTGNMKHVFVRSGLFDWVPVGAATLKEGDVLLNVDFHTAMVQGEGGDIVSEFLINELGKLTGGIPGDQTRRESLIRPYYDFPWDGVLVYNGKADGAYEEDAFLDVSPL